MERDNSTKIDDEGKEGDQTKKKKSSAERVVKRSSA